MACKSGKHSGEAVPRVRSSRTSSTPSVRAWYVEPVTPLSELGYRYPIATNYPGIILIFASSSRYPENEAVIPIIEA